MRSKELRMIEMIETIETIETRETRETRETCSTLGGRTQQQTEGNTGLKYTGTNEGT